MRRGMVIDLKRCIGCYGCQLASLFQHGMSLNWGRISTEE